MITKEVQDFAWSVLPTEFKEEVKRLYDNSPALGAKAVLLLENLFGIHNLTSDAEGEEEMLPVEKSRVQQQYKRATQLKDDSDSKWELVGDQIERVLIGLFGSKCLPDEKSSTVEEVAKEIGYKAIKYLEDYFNNWNKEPEFMVVNEEQYMNIALNILQGLLASGKNRVVDNAFNIADSFVQELNKRYK